MIHIQRPPNKFSCGKNPQEASEERFSESNMHADPSQRRRRDRSICQSTSIREYYYQHQVCGDLIVYNVCLESDLTKPVSVSEEELFPSDFTGLA